MGHPFPLADPADPIRRVIAPTAAQRIEIAGGRVVARMRRRGRRRLAMVDSHFPWRMSGFRYHEAEEILRRLPDTVFFSLHRLTDPFPVPVHELADFPRLAPAMGVTDVHAVFLNFAAGLLGLEGRPEFTHVPGARDDISLDAALRRYGIRAHVTLYPGGGWFPNTGPDVLAAIAERATTVFASHDAILSQLPGAIRTTVPVPSEFYPYVERRPNSLPLRLVFVGDDRPRKGLSVLLDAFRELQGTCTLDIVGPHERHSDRLGPGTTAHGWLDPDRLRDVVQQCDVIVSPSSTDRTEDGYGDVGLADGFPTTSARVAMLTGCALVASNPERDVTLVRPDMEYVDVPERDPPALARAILALADDPIRRIDVAARGARRLRDVSDVRVVVGRKLEAMQLA